AGHDHRWPGRGGRQGFGRVRRRPDLDVAVDRRVGCDGALCTTLRAGPVAAHAPVRRPGARGPPLGPPPPARAPKPPPGPRQPPARTRDAHPGANEQVKSRGSSDSTTRPAEQPQIALFWAGVGVTNAGVSIWNQTTETVSVAHHLSLADNARLYAQMTVASAD